MISTALLPLRSLLYDILLHEPIAQDTKKLRLLVRNLHLIAKSSIVVVEDIKIHIHIASRDRPCQAPREHIERRERRDLRSKVSPGQQKLRDLPQELRSFLVLLHLRHHDTIARQISPGGSK